MSRGKNGTDATTIRCAIYTRKSSDEGLDLEFNSLDAQRESAEAYIASQKGQGWVVVPERYDDGGFSGGSMERPALERLMRDIEAGTIDCVVVYKVDRLSRSLMDFARIMDAFEQRGVSFVSVTQQFSTTNSMGRLTLNILLSFAQFEREIIGERIRDKVAAQKRKGKWAGGVPVLGYDVDRSGPSPRLVVNVAEAARVREIFDLYLELGSLQPVVEELGERNWVTKRRVTKKGKTVGGRAFDKANLYALLRNPILIGKITHKDEVYEGEHQAIVESDVFERVQARLSAHGRGGGSRKRNKYGALLRGLLRCKSCDRAMTHTFSSRRRNGRCYRYYRCSRAIKGGTGACRTRTLPAAEIERVVVDEIRGIVRDKRLIDEVVAEARRESISELDRLTDERKALTRSLNRDRRAFQRLLDDGKTVENTTARMLDLQMRMSEAERRLSELEPRIDKIKRDRISSTDARAALADFDSIWDSLHPREQTRLLNLLVKQVVYDGSNDTVSVTFRPTSIRTLLDHRRPHDQENAA